MLSFKFVFAKILIFLIHSGLCLTPTYVCDKNRVPCGCGRTNVGINARIVNGEDALSDSWSMIVSLRLSNEPSIHRCGGTILSESYVLTAAHCVDLYIADTNETHTWLSIAANVHDLSQRNQIMRRVDKIIIHPLWQKLQRQYQYDIALLHLAEPLDLQANSSISRACLPPRQNSLQEIMEYPLNGTRLIAIGWGTLTYAGESPDILQQVTLYSMHRSTRICSDTTSDPAVHFCAGWYNDSKSTCHGDSGGPIFQWVGDRWEQVGVTSYGENLCGINKYPPVFTRVSYFHDWIQSYILNTNQTDPTSDNTIANSRQLYDCSRSTYSCGCSRRNVVLSPAEFAENENALPNTWSMVVSIRLRSTNQHICAGTILNESDILTAAHCLQNRLAQDLIIAAGMYYLSENNIIFRQVQRISIHPNYTADANIYTNDIALLHLSLPIDGYDERDTSQICLPSSNDRWIGMNQDSLDSIRLVVTGWNMTNNNNSINPEILQQAEIFTINRNHSNCSETSDQSQFCAGHREQMNNRCNGNTFDNPIFQWNNQKWTQVGLASYCRMSDGLTIFTNLTEYTTWIQMTKTSLTKTSSTIFQCDKKASCGCGQIDVNLTTSGVMHTENVIESSWPMVVSIQYLNYHRCVGSILSDLFILTSSYCVRYYKADEITILAGTSDLSDTDKSVRRQAAKIYHYDQNLNYGQFRHDIAVIQLTQSLIFDSVPSKLSKTCLSKTYNLLQYSNSSLAIIVWNQDYESGRSFDILQQTSMKLLDDNHRLCYRYIVNKTYEFCARPANNNPYLRMLNSPFGRTFHQ